MAPGIESERKERNGDGGVAEQKLLGCILLDTYGREGQRNEEKYSGDNPKWGSFRLLTGVGGGGEENGDLRFRTSILSCGFSAPTHGGIRVLNVARV